MKPVRGVVFFFLYLNLYLVYTVPTYLHRCVRCVSVVYRPKLYNTLYSHVKIVRVKHNYYYMCVVCRYIPLLKILAINGIRVVFPFSYIDRGRFGMYIGKYIYNGLFVVLFLLRRQLIINWIRFMYGL